MDSGSAQQLGLMGQKVIESDVFVGIVFSAGCDDARRRVRKTAWRVFGVVGWT